MNKTALVTGASSGIGYELARILAGDGYDLALVARREEKLLELKKEVEEKYKISARIFIKDLSKPGAADEILEELGKEKIQVEILINSAGFGDFGKFLETDWKREEQMLQLNITALVRLTKLVLPGMIARRSGKILNIASTAAFEPGPFMSVYFATKAFVLSFSEAVAYEVKNSGVTVTALCPGPTESGFEKSSAAGSALFKGRKLPAAGDVAAFGYRAMMTGKTVAIHGLTNKILIFLLRIAPRKLVTSMTARVITGL